MNKYLVLSLAFVLSLGTAFAQQAPNPQRPETVPVTDKDGKPVAVDIEIQLQLEKEKNVQKDYQMQLMQLQAKLQPEYDKIDALLNAAVEEQKKKNNWGNDVSFDRQTGQFVKVAPMPVPVQHPAPSPVK